MNCLEMIVLSDEVRDVRDELIRSTLTSLRPALRARIIVLAPTGLRERQNAMALSVGRIQAASLHERYRKSSLRGIARDLPRGAPPRPVAGAPSRAEHPGQARRSHALEHPHPGR